MRHLCLVPTALLLLCTPVWAKWGPADKASLIAGSDIIVVAEMVQEKSRQGGGSEWEQVVTWRTVQVLKGSVPITFDVVGRRTRACKPQCFFDPVRPGTRHLLFLRKHGEGLRVFNGHHGAPAIADGTLPWFAPGTDRPWERVPTPEETVLADIRKILKAG